MRLRVRAQSAQCRNVRFMELKFSEEFCFSSESQFSSEWSSGVLCNTDQHIFLIKDYIVHILGCADRTISVPTTQHCCWSAKAIADNARMDDCGCVPRKLYLRTLKLELHTTVM